MKALELAHVGPERMRRHAPVAEYDAYLERWIDQPVYRRMLRHARDEFLAHYPDLETWFAAPLLERVGRERRDGVRSSCKTLGDQARSYLHYLGLSGRSEEHTSELQSRENLVCRLLLEKKKKKIKNNENNINTENQ